MCSWLPSDWTKTSAASAARLPPVWSSSEEVAQWHTPSAPVWWTPPSVAQEESSSEPQQGERTRLLVSSVLTGNLRGPYLASCRAEADLKGVGVQGDDSMMERWRFGVLNLAEEEKTSRKSCPRHKRFAVGLHRGDGAAHMSSFWDLRAWPLRGLDSTGEAIGKLSSECSELIDWLRNWNTKCKICQLSVARWMFR